MEETRAKIIQSQVEAVEQEDAPWCEICYSVELVPEGKPIPDGELGTVEFECKHRFCSECTVE